MFLLQTLSRNLEMLIVQSYLSADNVCRFYALSELYHLIYLREECFDYIIVNYDQLDGAELQELPEKLFGEIQRFVCGQRKAHLLTLLSTRAEVTSFMLRGGKTAPARRGGDEKIEKKKIKIIMQR